MSYFKLKTGNWICKLLKTKGMVSVIKHNKKKSVQLVFTDMDFCIENHDMDFVYHYFLSNKYYC